MSFFERLKRLLGGETGSAGGNGTPGAGRHGDGGSTGRPPISCAEALERLHEFLDGELEGVTAAEVTHHFEICKLCFPHLKLEERFREALRRSQSGETCPDHVRAQVLEVLAAEAGDER